MYILVQDWRLIHINTKNNSFSYLVLLSFKIINRGCMQLLECITSYIILYTQ